MLLRSCWKKEVMTGPARPDRGSFYLGGTGTEVDRGKKSVLTKGSNIGIRSHRDQQNLRQPSPLATGWIRLRLRNGAAHRTPNTQRGKLNRSGEELVERQRLSSSTMQGKELERARLHVEMPPKTGARRGSARLEVQPKGRPVL